MLINLAMNWGLEMTKPKELTFYFHADTIKQLEAIRDYVRSHFGEDIPRDAVAGVGVVDYIVKVAKRGY